MKLEDQVCSLELAKKLKELGVKQKSLFYYQEKSGPNGWGLVIHSPISEPQDLDGLASAFTVAELGEILPYHTDSGKNAANGYSCWMAMSEGGDETFWDLKNVDDPKMFSERTEADARAKMLIYLIENKLIGISAITA